MFEFDWRLWALKTGLLLGAFIALRILNLPTSSRHLQRWVPVAAAVALVAYLAAAVIFEMLLGGISELYELIAHWVLPPMQALWHYFGVHSITFMLFGILSLWVFVGVKCVLLGIALSFAAMRRLSNWIRSRLKKADSRTKISTLFPAYEQDSSGSAILKSGLYYGRIATDVAGKVLVVFLLVAVTMHVPKDLAVLLQMLPVKIWWPTYVLLAIFLLETSWYLGGIDPDKAAEDISGKDVSARRGQASEHLVKHYEQLWPSNWLVRSVRRQQPVDQEEQGRPVVPDIEEGPWVSRLSEGEDLVLARFENVRCQQDLFNAFTEKLAQGGRLLVLLDERHWYKPGVTDELDTWLSEGFDLVEGGAIPWKWQIDLGFPLGDEQIWICTSQAIANHLGDRAHSTRWFAGVSLVVFLDADGDFSPLSTRYSLAEAFGFDSPRAILVLASDGKRIESAFRENLKLATRVKKYTLPRPRPDVTAWVWRTDAERSYESKLVEGPNLESMGVEMSLAVPALADPGTSGVLLVESDHVPLHDFQENLQANLGRQANWTQWQDRIGNVRSYSFDEKRLRVLSHVGLWSLYPESKDHVIIAHDEMCNFPLLIERLAAKSSSDIHIHVISRPFLLRQYFSAYIEFFLANPLVPLVPMVTDLPRTVAERIVHQMLTVGVTDESLRAQLRDAGVGFHSAEVGLWQLLSAQFKVDIFGEKLLEKREERLSLNERIKDHSGVSWLQVVPLISTDAAQPRLGEVRKEHVYQQFLPEQRFTFNGKLYRVEQITQDAVQFEHSDPDRPVHEYRSHLVLKYGERPMIPAGNRCVVRRANGLELRHGLFLIPEFSAKVLGYYEFEKGKFERYTILGEIPERSYGNARTTLLEFNGDFGDLDKPAISFTLAVLINELIPSLLPGREKFCLVCPLHRFERDNMDPPADPASLCIPEVDWDHSGAFFSAFQKSIGMLMVEDSQSDLGLAQALYDEIDYILTILHDYLHWVVHEEKSFPGGKRWPSNPGCDRSPFLCFGVGDSFSESLDLKGLKTLLERWHGGEADLTGRRRDFYSGAGTGSLSSGKKALQVADEREYAVCDICGYRGEKGGFDELSDGRLRCGSCRKKAVDKVEEAEKLYVDAVEFIEERHDISIPLGGRVRLTDAQEIGERSDRPFEPTPEFDGRAIGLAIRNQDGNWEVLVELGMPDYMVSSVLVHELTHIWQFDNLDMDKAGLGMIEGHAVWSEVDFLESRRLVPHYVKGIKERQDPVYGEGYRELCRRMDSDKEESAFRFMLNRFARSNE